MLRAPWRLPAWNAAGGARVHEHGRAVAVAHVAHAVQLDLHDADQRPPGRRAELVAADVGVAGLEQLLGQPLALPAERPVAVEHDRAGRVRHQALDLRDVRDVDRHRHARASPTTFSAPGMWLTAYSMCGRLSKTTALWSARICRSSSVLTSAVFWFGSFSVAWKMLAIWASAFVAGCGPPYPASTIAAATSAPSRRASRPAEPPPESRPCA